MNPILIKKPLLSAMLAVACISGAGLAHAQMDKMDNMSNDHAVMVGGQSMLPARDIVDNAVNSARSHYPGCCRQGRRTGRHAQG